MGTMDRAAHRLAAAVLPLTLAAAVAALLLPSPAVAERGLLRTGPGATTHGPGKVGA
jgi:hypothetical protein